MNRNIVYIGAGYIGGSTMAVIDMRNCLDADMLRKTGFKVLNIGK